MTSAPSRPDGPHRLQVEWGGMTRTFDGDRVVIGREADCDVTVHEPSASRHHAVLQREPSGWVVVDTSSNGTFVRGQRVTRLAVPMSPLSLHLGGPAGEAVVVSMVAAAPASRPAPPPYQAEVAAPPPYQPQVPAPPPYQPQVAAPPPYQPGPAAPNAEWWR
jgi:ABC transport system ATP-binding/permease protein